MEEGTIGFHLAHDHFHLSRTFTTWSLMDRDWIPEQHIDEVAFYEERARFGDICIKPRHCLDLFLHALKGPYQCLLDRNDIRIKRIPVQMAHFVAGTLESRVEFDGMLFHRRKDPDAPRWSVCEHKDYDGNIDVAFRDIKLSFAPSASLKSLAQHVLGEEDVFSMADLNAPMPNDKKQKRGYAPYALAWGRPGAWNDAWPAFAEANIEFWHSNVAGRKYAWRDVDWTRRLHQHEKFADAELDDDDSVLACAVGATRWRGFALDLEKLKVKRDEAAELAQSAPTAPQASAAYMAEVMTEPQKIVLKARGTADTVLGEIGGNWDEDDECWFGQWQDESGVDYPVVERARVIRAARKAGKVKEQCEKMLIAGRLHPAFKLIKKSYRMGGDGDFNVQGVIAEKTFRQCFLIPEPGEELDGGDFAAFESTIQAATWPDEQFTADLESGQNFHAIFATCIYPHLSYEQVMASKGSKVKDYYSYGKRGGFGASYFGDWKTLVNRLGVEETIAKAAMERYAARYPDYMAARSKLTQDFCSMRQPEGQGTRVEWHEPVETIDNGLGFSRFFTLENKVCWTLFELANRPPRHWFSVKGDVRRRDRVQSPTGACQSALYGAAFGLQGANMRAAGNHVIQSKGAAITKRLQRRLVDLQPHGVNPWRVRAINAHDEVLLMIKPFMRQLVYDTMVGTVEGYRSVVPLIKIEWGQRLTSWKCGVEKCIGCDLEQGIGVLKNGKCPTCLIK